jgi:hypothetical protein
MPIGDDEGGVTVEVWQQPGSDGLFALVLSAVGAQRAESDGVGTAFGREVSTEAEHVRPGGQPQLFQFGELAEAEAFGDEAAGVIADRQCVELVSRSEAAVEGPGAIRALVAYLAM